MDGTEGMNVEKQLLVLKRSRTGKKGAITKRIRKLEALVEESGKRKVIRPLLIGLERLFNELVQVCNEITHLSDDVDPLNCLEDIRGEVEVCVVECNEHLEARKDEPDSSGSYTSSWVNKHAELASVVTGSSGDDVTGGESDAVPKQEFFTPEGIARSLATGFTGGSEIRGETDGGVASGTVEGSQGMAFNPISISVDTALSPPAVKKPEALFESRDATSSTVDSHSVSNSLLDITVLEEDFVSGETKMELDSRGNHESGPSILCVHFPLVDV